MKQLKDMMGKVLTAVEENKCVVVRMVSMVLPSDEVTEKELFHQAYRLFGVTSESDADDDLIVDHENTTPKSGI
jgi:hypothetical protein